MSHQPLADSSAAPLCDKNPYHPHLVSAHGHDGHRFAHNPWSDNCVKRLHNEPSCPDARCMTCDGGSREI